MLKRTPLFDEEQSLGARFIDFAGWEMPLYYSSIIDEHMSVRTSAGLFDISHLGKIRVKGKGSFELLQRLATYDIKNISIGSGGYTVFCNENGGIIDDDIVYRTDDANYLVVTNAARLGALFSWIKMHNNVGTDIDDRTERLCLLALQGPKTPELLRDVINEDPGAYKRYSVREVATHGITFIMMRSGYTGEEGYEIIAEPDAAKRIWKSLLDNGVAPAGLGARDILRLEMGYPLYGKDITIDTTPLEADLRWLINFGKGPFIGKEALLSQDEIGVRRTLVGFVLDKGIARGGERILDSQDEEIGEVTSGGYSPVLKVSIGLGYVRAEYAKPGSEIKIDVRNKRLTGRIEKRPFIKR